MAAVFGPPAQAYEAPPEAVTVVEVAVQVSTVLPVKAMVGDMMFLVIVIEAVAVQPLPPVAVTL